MDRRLGPLVRRVRVCSAVIILICLLPTQAAVAGEPDPTQDQDFDAPAPAAAPSGVSQDMQLSRPGDPPPNLRLRNALIIGTGATLVTAYGMSKWWQSGFGGGFKTTNEGWFGQNTESGGADKLGHMYFNYGSVRLLTPLFEGAGNSREASVSLAAWTTVGIFAAVEVADGFSRRYKFSPQDMVMNVAGTVLGVALETHPELDEKFDIPVDYRPSSG